MKRDKLESFILRNREQFEMQEPHQDLWSKVEIPARKSGRKLRIWITGVAASLIIIALSVGVTRLFSPSGRDTAQEKEIRKQYPELIEAEVYYSGLIREKLSEAEPQLTRNPELKDELVRDFSDLDSLYAGLKADLKDNIRNGEVIQAMIQNYRMRIRILEDLLDELNKEQHEKPEKPDEIKL